MSVSTAQKFGMLKVGLSTECRRECGGRVGILLQIQHDRPLAFTAWCVGDLRPYGPTTDFCDQLQRFALTRALFMNRSPKTRTFTSGLSKQ